MRALIVREPFGDYAKGQAIIDPEEIAAVQNAGQAQFCTARERADDFFKDAEPQPAPVDAKPVAVAPAPAPQPAPAPAAAPQSTPPAAPAAPSA